MTIQRFRTRPSEFDGVQWSGAAEDAHEIIQWVNEVDGWTAVWREYRPYSSGGLFPQEQQDRIEEGIYVRRDGSWKEQFVGPLDYLVSIGGNFHARKRAAFEDIYEPAANLSGP